MYPPFFLSYPCRPPPHVGDTSQSDASVHSPNEDHLNPPHDMPFSSARMIQFPFFIAAFTAASISLGVITVSINFCFPVVHDTKESVPNPKRHQGALCIQRRWQRCGGVDAPATVGYRGQSVKFRWALHNIVSGWCQGDHTEYCNTLWLHVNSKLCCAFCYSLCVRFPPTSATSCAGTVPSAKNCSISTSVQRANRPSARLASRPPS